MARRLVTAVGIYTAAALGFLATVVAARSFSTSVLGLYAIVVATTGFFQTLLDLTVEEACVKYGFRYEAQAQLHCPGDTVVWLDFRKRRYYARGRRLYGRGFDGSFVCLQEARSSQYRRSLLGR